MVYKYFEAVRKLKKKRLLYRAARYGEDQAAWEKYYTSENTYITTLRHSKRTFYEIDLPNMLISNPKQFWKVVNGDDTRDLVISSDSGGTLSDTECAEVFKSAFATVFTSDLDTPVSLPPGTISSSMPNLTFSVNGISCIINNLKLSSSAGTDEINTKL